mmetsp:Transcript_15124/g.48340  ORF Transcript_15124/g.48340 Transcript_15124/m.48340 type:complete len:288 (-) Transcript_15124:94-957(-)
MNPSAAMRILTFSAVLAVAAGDPCDCLNWRQLYQRKRVLCGEGYEFSRHGRFRDYEASWFAPYLMGSNAYIEFCEMFYKKMDNSYCANPWHYTYGEENVKPWCYVSKECTNLNGGEALQDKTGIPELPEFLLSETTYKVAKALYIWPTIHKRDVALKICTPGKDTLLSDLSVQQVFDLGKAMHTTVPVVMRKAFPQAKGPHTPSLRWADVEDAVAKGDVNALPPPIDQAVKDKKPILVDVDDVGISIRLLVGKEVFELEGKCDWTGCSADGWTLRKWVMGDMQPLRQ